MLALDIIPSGARYVIPIAGVIVGKSMNVASVTAVRLVRDAGDRRAQIEAALALGASPRQCTASVIRRSVKLTMVPVVDSTKTMGISRNVRGICGNEQRCLLGQAPIPILPRPLRATQIGRASCRERV